MGTDGVGGSVTTMGEVSRGRKTVFIHASCHKKTAMLLRGATLAALCVAASGFVGGAPWAARTTVGSAPLVVATARRPAARSPLSLQLSAGDAEDEAKKEAQKWADMAARMKAQRAAAAGANVEPAPPMEGQPGFVPGTGKASLGVEDLKQLEGKVLPAPAIGELESLMAKADAFKAKQQASKRPATRLAGDKAPARLVGGDAGSLRQAAPFQPGESKAGNIAEGWDQQGIDDMKRAEAEWQAQLAVKKEEERAANALAADAARFQIGPDLVSQKGVPSSMEAAVVQSLLSSVDVMKRGCGRFRIDVDTTGGDETYTTLKNSVPFTRVFCKGLAVNGFSQVKLVFPDVGASALAMRDWAGEDGHVASSFGRSAPEVDESDDVVVCIAPASSEIEQLRKLADRTAELGLPLILINPSVKSAGGENLGSLGAYAIGLSDFLRTFEYAYYLRTLDWGVILRKYPDGFQIYNQVGPRKYELIETLNSMPSGVKLEEIYLSAYPEAATEGLQAISTGLSRFLDQYTRG